MSKYQIKKVERFVIFGTEHKTLESAQRAIDERIGALAERLRKDADLNIPSAIKIYDWLYENRRELVDILGIEPYTDEED